MLARDQHPVVPLVEEWRELTKLLNTYLEPLPARLDPVTGRLHTTFNQLVASTGRLSSSNPNLQNIPVRTDLGQEIRACFVAEEGAKLLVAPNGSKLKLTEKETAILRFLYRAERKVVTRDVLLTEVWGYNANVTTHTLETHIYRLRQKIERDPSNAQILVTEAGGYKLLP